MLNDILTILMVAFGLFAVVMFIVFYAYLKKYYNSHHIDDDYKNSIKQDEKYDIEDSKEEFMPKKKK